MSTSFVQHGSIPSLMDSCFLGFAIVLIAILCVCSLACLCGRKKRAPWTGFVYGLFDWSRPPVNPKPEQRPKVKILKGKNSKGNKTKLVTNGKRPPKQKFDNPDDEVIKNTDSFKKEEPDKEDVVDDHRILSEDDTSHPRRQTKNKKKKTRHQGQPDQGQPEQGQLDPKTRKQHCLQEMDRDARDGMQSLFDECFKSIDSVDRSGERPSRLVVKSVKRIQNEHITKRYRDRCTQLKKELGHTQWPVGTFQVWTKDGPKELKKELQGTCVMYEGKKRDKYELFLETLPSEPRVHHPVCWKAHRSFWITQGRPLPSEWVEEIECEVPRPITSDASLQLDDDSELKVTFDSLDKDVSEHLLFHGTKTADGIMEDNFKLDLAGTNGNMYGRGVYLAECVSKSDEYTKPNKHGTKTILVCRASLFRMLHTADPQPARFLGPNALFESVCGDREASSMTYREFIVYDENLVCPEYVVEYKREYAGR